MLSSSTRLSACSRSLRSPQLVRGLSSSSRPLKLYRSNTNDPFWNLATEDWLFSRADQAHAFFWWRNGPSVIIGRFQNPWKECHVQKLEDDRVNLVRRHSGGGAVYQDLGNSIYSFIGPKPEFSIQKNNEILLKGLSKLGVTAAASGRNDLTVDGKKISGAAFKHSLTHSLHHGTLMVDVDIMALPKYLNPNKAKLLSKGVTSVEARVVNLKQLLPSLDHERLGAVMMDSFLEAHGAAPGSVQVEELDIAKLQREPAVRSAYEQLHDWAFRFGKTPEFSHHVETRFDWGIMDVHLDCKKGAIERAVIFSDCLYPALIEALTKALQGAVYSAEGVRTACAAAKLAVAGTPAEALVDPFAQWLVAQL